MNDSSRLFLLQLRRIIIGSASTAGSYKRIYYQRISALNILLQKQKLFDVNYSGVTPAGDQQDKSTPKFYKATSVLSSVSGNETKSTTKSCENDKVSPQSAALRGSTDAGTIADSTSTPPDSSTSSTTTTTENIWTIPNVLSFMRIGMAPVVAYMILNNQFGPALGVFAVAGVSDLLDGWIARVVPGQATVMGSFLDPMADKILVGTLFLSLTYVDLIPVLLTGLIIGRDAILIAFGFYIRYQSLDPPRTLQRYFNVTYPTAQLAPTLISKINTGVQLGLVGATIVSASAVLPYDVHPFLEFLWYFTATTTVVSAVGYLFAKDTVKLLRKSYPNKPK
ncbi:cardiolipin synthase (CMP-forming) isoform X2 [Folsomia candida]|uniref:cardiolipin synthase (CMP-forming) isoform X2 n=1 Tax=Folsomia candida TaxID=158441 RepID=UPI001604A3B9|nr:cardiolipin synthase (CMP-forming) isoform X2 [Folsomia candida]